MSQGNDDFKIQCGLSLLCFFSLPVLGCGYLREDTFNSFQDKIYTCKVMSSLARLSFSALQPSHTQLLSGNGNKARNKGRADQNTGESSDFLDDTNKMENDR